ncbi:MAG: ABC transporter ATP-binding protein [Planctomycetota bacterium]
MIEVKQLTKVFGDTLAVDNVSFTLPSGRICGLVGRNGAGKTTTMRCLAALVPPTRGSIRIAGHDPVSESTSVKRKLAYVPDDPPLFDDLSVHDHLEFIGRMYGVAEHRELAQRLLAQFGLDGKSNAGATTLSRGMRQKLAIACAMMFDPQVWLLDEPLTGLDPPGIRMVLDLIGQLAEQGRTVVLSSHLLSIIEPVCTDVLVLEDGRVRDFGPVNKEPTSPIITTSHFETTYFGSTHA